MRNTERCDNARDTQFKGFAKLILKKLIDNALDEYGLIFEGREQYADLNYDLTVCEDIITRGAYDFAVHVADNTTILNRDEVSFYYVENDVVHGISDMTELPKESS